MKRPARTPRTGETSTADKARIARPPGGFGVVYADPPWRYLNWSAKGEAKNPVAQYRCMTLEELAGLRITLGLDFLCAKDCVLIMWGTWPMALSCYALAAAWGFQWKTGGAWVKTTSNGKITMGAGYIYRGASEFWVLGTRGAPKSRSRSIRNALIDPRREHSRKPDRMYEMIETQWDGPYLELFSRSDRPGWTAWGDEAGKFGS